MAPIKKENVMAENNGSGQITWKQLVEQMQIADRRVDEGLKDINTSIKETTGPIYDELNALGKRVEKLSEQSRHPCVLHGKVESSIASIKTKVDGLASRPEAIGKAKERTLATTFAVIGAVFLALTFIMSLVGLLK